MLYQSHHYHLPPHNIPASFWLKFKIQHGSFLSRGLAPSSPLSFYQSFLRVFLHPAESGVFSKVRVCEAQRSNESPSGAFKRQNGLAQQDGGASPRQVHVCEAQQSNESPSGAFKRQNGLAQQDGGASPRQVPIYRVAKIIHPSADDPKTVVRSFYARAS